MWVRMRDEATQCVVVVLGKGWGWAEGKVGIVRLIVWGGQFPLAYYSIPPFLSYLAPKCVTAFPVNAEEAVVVFNAGNRLEQLNLGLGCLHVQARVLRKMLNRVA